MVIVVDSARVLGEVNHMLRHRPPRRPDAAGSQEQGIESSRLRTARPKRKAGRRQKTK